MIKIGADPEFEIYSGKTFIPANRYFHGANACHTQLGCDGRSDTGELRPPPGTPKQVYQGINRILTRAKSKFTNADVFAGSGSYAPLGGHIHFSGIGENSYLINLLDKLIATPLNEVSNTSRRENYRELGQVRSQPHGWEYRSPCSWLVHPVITRGILEVAYACAKLFDSDGLNDYDSYSVLQRLVNSIQNIADLMPYISEDARRYVTACYDMLARIKEKHLTLEKIEVFRAWRKKPLSNTLPSLPTALLHRSLKENNFDAIWREFCSILIDNLDKYQIDSNVASIVFSGASINRSHDVVVFLPYNATYEDFANLGVEVEHWDLDTVGLSVRLRENTCCADVMWKYLVLCATPDLDTPIRTIEEVTCAE